VTTCDVATLSACLGVTDRTIQRLAQSGTVVRVGRSEYDLPQSIKNYIQKIEAEHSDKSEYRKSRQLSIDLDNELKQEALAKSRDELIETIVVDRQLAEYATGITKLHKNFTPDIRKKFPKTDKRVLDFIDQKLKQIRDACYMCRVTEPEDLETEPQ